MKKLIIFIILLLFGATSYQNGQSISKDVAESTAINFFTSKTDISTSRPEIEKIEDVKINNKDVLSVVNFKGGGWVMISRDEKFEPILGYNKEGSFYPSSLKEHDHRELFLNLYANEIFKGSTKSKTKNSKWEYYKKAQNINMREYEDLVSPLLKSSWSDWPPYRVSWPEDRLDLWNCLI